MTKLLSKILGLLLILVGLWLGATILAFASLINLSFDDATWWAQYWNNISWGGLGMNLTMIALGAWLVVVPPPPEKELAKKREG